MHLGTVHGTGASGGGGGGTAVGPQKKFEKIDTMSVAYAVAYRMNSPLAILRQTVHDNGVVPLTKLVTRLNSPEDRKGDVSPARDKTAHPHTHDIISVAECIRPGIAHPLVQSQCYEYTIVPATTTTTALKQHAATWKVPSGWSENDTWHVWHETLVQANTKWSSVIEVIVEHKTDCTICTTTRQGSSRWSHSIWGASSAPSRLRS